MTQRVKWTIVLIFLIIQPSYNVASESSESDEMQVLADTKLSQILKRKLDDLHSDVNLYNSIVDNFLQPTYETIQLQNQISIFTSSVNDQLNTISELKENLTRDETFMNTSLFRQEEQLSKLEPQLYQLENQWRNKSTELDQLKQLWGDLAQKAVTRTGEVQSLRQSIIGLEERLGQHAAKVDQQERDVTDLDAKIDSAEESLRSLQDVVQESLNKQGQLEGLLVALQTELAEVRARGGSGGGRAATIVVANTQADSLCKRVLGN